MTETLLPEFSTAGRIGYGAVYRKNARKSYNDKYEI